MPNSQHVEAITVSPFFAAANQLNQQLNQLEVNRDQLSEEANRVLGNTLLELQVADDAAGLLANDYQRLMIVVAQTALNRCVQAGNIQLVNAAIATGKKQIREIQISAKRWFSKTDGNTYHTVKVWITDEHGNAHKFQSEVTYGHGMNFLDTAQALLESAGFDLRFPKRDNAATQSLTTLHLRETLGGSYSVADVQRKREL